MTNFQFLQKYFELQTHIMFDELQSLPHATICLNYRDPSPFWNNALVNTLLSDSQLEQIESALLRAQRAPAVYFERRPDLRKLEERLENHNYTSAAEDSLMFFESTVAPDGGFSQVKKVETELELQTFLEIFDQCYQKDDPLNPYGELGEYLQVTKEVWQKHHHTHRIQYFIVYDKENPVAVSSLTCHQGLGYLSNIGSLRDVRGRGFGKLATLYAVHQSQQLGNEHHFLATEEKTNPNSFYQALGFKTKFIAKLMAKKTDR